MNKNLYIFLALFMGLTAACSLVNSIASLQLGSEIFTVDYYLAWFIAANITITIGWVLLLKYYYYRNYRFAFFTGLIVVAANSGLAVIICIILTSGKLSSYYAPGFMICLITGIIYAASLVFSNARERFWLRLAGACSLIASMILLWAFIANISGHAAPASFNILKIGQWATIALGLAPILYVMNFVNEIKTLKAASTATPGPNPLEGIFGISVVIAFMVMVTLGTLLISDCYEKRYWQNFNAEKAQQMVKLAGGEQTFVDSKGASLHYILLKPYNYNPQKKYPLVVCLPYGSYQAGAAEVLSAGVCRTSYPAFIFVPYCPEGEGWGGIPGVPSLDLVVYETINALAVPGIDVKRRYVTGISRGGYGTWQFICSRPDMFAAALPVCGGGDPKLASKVVNMPIWAFHGAKDKNVPISGSRYMIAAIKKAGGHPEYTEYPNQGHDIWGQVSDTPGLWNWLFAQKQE
jgi:hypothetical protein